MSISLCGKQWCRAVCLIGCLMMIFGFSASVTHGYDDPAWLSCIPGVESLDSAQETAVNVLVERLNELVEMQRISLASLVSVMGQLADDSSFSPRKSEVIAVLHEYYDMKWNGERCDNDIVGDIIDELDKLEDGCPEYDVPWLPSWCEYMEFAEWTDGQGCSRKILKCEANDYVEDRCGQQWLWSSNDADIECSYQVIVHPDRCDIVDVECKEPPQTPPTEPKEPDGGNDGDFKVCEWHPHPWAVDPAPPCTIELVHDTENDCKYGKIVCPDQPEECTKPQLPHDNCRYETVAIGSAIGSCPQYEVICGEEDEDDGWYEEPKTPQCLTITKPRLPSGCRYGEPTDKDEAGCPAYEVICPDVDDGLEKRPVECPEYAIAMPPYGCEYVRSKDSNGCEVPRLKCQSVWINNNRWWFSTSAW